MRIIILCDKTHEKKLCILIGSLSNDEAGALLTSREEEKKEINH